MIVDLRLYHAIRFRDVVGAYKATLKEKEALESSIAAWGGGGGESSEQHGADVQPATEVRSTCICLGREFMRERQLCGSELYTCAYLAQLLITLHTFTSLTGRRFCIR